MPVELPEGIDPSSPGRAGFATDFRAMAGLRNLAIGDGDAYRSHGGTWTPQAVWTVS